MIYGLSFPLYLEIQVVCLQSHIASCTEYEAWERTKRNTPIARRTHTLAFACTYLFTSSWQIVSIGPCKGRKANTPGAICCLAKVYSEILDTQVKLDPQDRKSSCQSSRVHKPRCHSSLRRTCPELFFRLLLFFSHRQSEGYFVIRPHTHTHMHSLPLCVISPPRRCCQMLFTEALRGKWFIFSSRGVCFCNTLFGKKKRGYNHVFLSDFPPQPLEAQRTKPIVHHHNHASLLPRRVF